MTLNIKRCRSSLANSEDPVMKCSIPLIIHELGVSPGCTLAVSTMMLLFFRSSYENRFVKRFISKRIEVFDKRLDNHRDLKILRLLTAVPGDVTVRM